MVVRKDVICMDSQLHHVQITAISESKNEDGGSVEFKGYICDGPLSAETFKFSVEVLDE